MQVKPFHESKAIHIRASKASRIMHAHHCTPYNASKALRIV